MHRRRLFLTTKYQGALARGIRTVPGMTLFSLRPGPVSMELELPLGMKVQAEFLDDGSVRDITAGCPDLLLEFLLAGGQAQADGTNGSDDVHVASIRLEGGTWSDMEVFLCDSPSGRREQLPRERVPELLSGALAYAIEQAISRSAQH